MFNGTNSSLNKYIAGDDSDESLKLMIDHHGWEHSNKKVSMALREIANSLHRI